MNGKANERTGAIADPVSDNRPSGTVAIIGLGLLGASLAMALRRRCPELRILGYARRDDTVREALARQIIDVGSTDPAAILPPADFTVICVPIRATLEFIETYAGCWRPGAVVTDVGSVKTPIVRCAQRHLRGKGVHFVGSHPMAGSERSGLGNAVPTLFENATVFVTALPEDEATAVAAVKDFWARLGAAPHAIGPEPHDALVARTSHALHLLSSASVRAYLREAESHLATGGAFRDVSRIAASSPDMWREIVEYNRDNIIAALDDLVTEIQNLRQTLTNRNWQELTAYLADARRSREEWYAQRTQRRGPSA